MIGTSDQKVASRQRCGTTAGPLYWGYRRGYDLLFTLGAPNQPESFPFQSGNKSYVIWAWVGDYPAVGDGGEVAVYSQNSTLAKAGPVWHADPGDADLPLLAMSVSDKGVPIAWAAPSQPQPWVPAWNPSVQDRNVHNLKFTATVTFPNAGMYGAFERSKYVAGNPLWTPGPPGTNTATLSFTG